MVLSRIRITDRGRRRLVEALYGDPYPGLVVGAGSAEMIFPLPIVVRVGHDGIPKLFAAGAPVSPVNACLVRRSRLDGSTTVSLDSYARAMVLYLVFCAHLGRGMTEVTNSDFEAFKAALLGERFTDRRGCSRVLPGQRGRRSADHILTLVHSIAGDIEELYGAKFAWRRYREVAEVLPAAQIGARRRIRIARVHRIRWRGTRVKGLPDEQFVRLLRAAHERWSGEVSDGDRAFASEPERQRGALFIRNVAILMVLRGLGSRRSEAVEVDLLDWDVQQRLVYLVTKGHRAAPDRKLPVVLPDIVWDVVRTYVTRFRPAVRADDAALFLSHSVRNYGQRISPQAVRRVVEVLRPSLDPPWDRECAPHHLRHAYGYDLQRLAGPLAVTANMRHASITSSQAYVGGAETFRDQLSTLGAELRDALARAGLVEVAS